MKGRLKNSLLIYGHRKASGMVEIFYIKRLKLLVTKREKNNTSNINSTYQ